MSDIRVIDAEVQALKQRRTFHDLKAAQVHAILAGRPEDVAPDLFSDEYPTSTVANRIDVMARHGGAALSVLPNFSCRAATSGADAARRRDDTRTKIVNHYAVASNLQTQLVTDRAKEFYAYGLIVTTVLPDAKTKSPLIVCEDPFGFYPVWDRIGRTVKIAYQFRRLAVEVLAQYPELAGKILEASGGYRIGQTTIDPSTTVKLTRYESADRIVVYLTDTKVALLDEPNQLGECSYTATRLPAQNGEVKGAFDDLIWPQLALHSMQMTVMSAAQQAVEAPIAVPQDVHEVPVGPGAIIHANDPNSIHRVSLDVPAAAFATVGQIQEDLQYGAIVPQALSGALDSGTTTGKGLQQLMSGYSQQMANAQLALVGHWAEVMRKALKTDELYWPAERKEITGQAKNTPYALTYVPEKDIAGNHTVDVQYGGVAGMDPNRAAVFMLQLQGSGAVSVDTVRENMPLNIDGPEEDKKIAVEALRKAALQALAGYALTAQTAGQTGGSASEVVKGIQAAIKAVQKGAPIEEALDAVFPPPPPPEPAPAAAAASPLDTGAGAALPEGVTPALATRGAGARPDLMRFFSGLSADGRPNMTANVMRDIPAVA